MNTKRLAFSAVAMLCALCADAGSVIVDYFFDEEHYVGTAITNAYDVVVSPYEAILRNDPITFKLKQTPPGWHIRDWAVCTKGDLAARSLDNYEMLGIGAATSYTWEDLAASRVNIAIVFDRNAYTVAFNANGGERTMAAQ